MQKRILLHTHDKGVKEKMPPSSHPLGKLARQMLAKSSAKAALFTKGEGRRRYDINHADRSIKKNTSEYIMLLLKIWKETGQGEPKTYSCALFTHNNDLNSSRTSIE